MSTLGTMVIILVVILMRKIITTVFIKDYTRFTKDFIDKVHLIISPNFEKIQIKIQKTKRPAVFRKNLLYVRKSSFPQNQLKKISLLLQMTIIRAVVNFLKDWDGSCKFYIAHSSIKRDEKMLSMLLKTTPPGKRQPF